MLDSRCLPLSVLGGHTTNISGEDYCNIINGYITLGYSCKIAQLALSIGEPVSQLCR
jgi:hypothetical protein